MISQPPHTHSFLKRVIRRLGLDSKQDNYFFRMPNLKSSKGSFITLAAVFMVVVAILIPVGMVLLNSVRTNTQQAQEFVAGAQNAAKAGLEDALGYFVRQKVLITAFSGNVTAGATPTYVAGVSYVDQPFNPQYNASNPEYSDTFQATVTGPGMAHAFYGLCNEYSVDAYSNTIPAAGHSAVYYARYEVAEQTNPVVTPAPTLNPQAVHDISGLREANYVNGDGLVWGVNSTGYIYMRHDYTMDSYGEWLVPYNVSPNKVLATAKAYTEFRKLSCNLPNTIVGDAAVYCSNATNVNLNGFSYLNGKVAGGYALCAMSGTVTAPNGAGTTNFFGNGVTLNSSNGPISDVNVFGMSLKDIQNIADYVGSTNTPLSIVSSNKLSYFTGNLTYAATQTLPVYQQLNSSGILVVNGNFTLGPGSADGTIQPSYYAGLIFCTGNVTIGGGCDVDGIVVMGYTTNVASTNQLTLTGTVGNYAYLNSNPNVITSTLNLVAQYREDISSRRVLLAFPGI